MPFPQSTMYFPPTHFIRLTPLYLFYLFFRSWLRHHLPDESSPGLPGLSEMLPRGTPLAFCAASLHADY